ncbi:Sorbitol dehydrogenase-like [Oopsacas minuta]|uniref:Sorbitol dehydrogenase-like n=1 Tax=Oopsacas minuta TaxID=111878 RepID=A0AAV7JZJ7_9METZ|nr:Sorbitol dehydrogenase-like [Oopsacas minuta]
MGADHLLNSSSEDFKSEIDKITEGNGVGVIVEASGVSSMLTGAFNLLRRGGKIVVIGLPKADIVIKDPMRNFLIKAVTVKSVYGRKIFHTWKESERAVAEKKVRSELLVTHKIPLTKFQEAYDLLCSGKAMKILIDPSK